MLHPRLESDVCRLKVSFLNEVEKNYAAIEGKSLEQTKYFTEGCKDLVVVTDHKPLIKIFGHCDLNKIQNTRIFRLKQLPWLFQVHYMSG